MASGDSQLAQIGKFTVETLGRRLVRLIGRGGIVEIAKIMSFPIRIDIGVPFLVKLRPRNAFVSRRIRSIFFAVLAVLKNCRFAQIYDSIVSFDAIDVVDMFFRPLAVMQRPRKAVSAIRTMFDISCQISAASDIVDHIFGGPHSMASDAPRKLSGFRIIVQKLAEPFNGCDRHMLDIATKALVYQGEL